MCSQFSPTCDYRACLRYSYAPTMAIGKLSDTPQHMLDGEFLPSVTQNCTWREPLHPIPHNIQKHLSSSQHARVHREAQPEKCRAAKAGYPPWSTSVASMLVGRLCHMWFRNGMTLVRTFSISTCRIQSDIRTEVHIISHHVSRFFPRAPGYKNLAAPHSYQQKI